MALAPSSLILANNFLPLNEALSTTNMKVQTDTATIVFYDLSCLKHRLQDRCDWWSDPKLEIEEINSGNAVFIGIGTDGVVSVDISESFPLDEFLVFNIKNESGTFFLGGGENVSGEDLEPDTDDGVFLEYKPGNYKVVAWVQKGELFLNIAITKEAAKNEYASSPKVA